MDDPTYGHCMAPQCRFWANRCNSNYCQPCCEKIHYGVTWSYHTRPDGSQYKWVYNASPGNTSSALPMHYGGQSNHSVEIEDPASPVVGAIEVVTDEGKVIVPVKDNSYFTPRGGTSGFPIQYDK